MDATVYETVRHLVADGIMSQTLLIVTLMVVISICSASLLAYLKRKAEHLATKTDVETLKAQLEANTRLTETIRHDLTKEYSLWHANVNFKRQQIEELYSPLLFLVQRKNWIQQQNERMQVSLDTHGGQNPEWATILKAFSEDDILPWRAKIAAYFKTKACLMEEAPESFSQVLRHDAENRPLHTLWSQKDIDGLITAADWPETLEEDIRCTTERLERELRERLKLPPMARSADAGTGTA